MLKARQIITVPSGTNIKLLEHNDTFLIKSVKVDNYSGHWMRVDPDRVFVPPFTIGMLIDLFVYSQQIGVYADRPPNINLVSTTNEADGVAIISMYDTPVFPFPGTFVNQPILQRPPFADANLIGSGDIVQDTPSTYQVIQWSYSLPLFWASAETNEANNQVQARQLLDVFAVEQICAAGVPTNIAGIVPDALHQRVMFIEVGTDTSGEIFIDYTGGLQLFRSFLMAGETVPVLFNNNGYNLNGNGASRFRATHDVGGVVYLTAGMAKT